MKILRSTLPAFLIAVLPVWACTTQDEAGETTIIEQPDIIVEDQRPDVIIQRDTIIEDRDGVQGEIRIGEDGVEGEIRVEEN
ncbi:MAG TPA: hypothetical protein VMR66_01530 [Gemmatimonadota bacterium]|nr:hypothetical protein [Gemmatimonadota bacterium]